jgi:hypothetical protein
MDILLSSRESYEFRKGNKTRVDDFVDSIQHCTVIDRYNLHLNTYQSLICSQLL